MEEYTYMENLTNIFVDAHTWAESLSIDQWLLLVVAAAALILAVKVLKKGLSVVAYIVAILAALYFLAPELYGVIISHITGWASRL